MNGFTKSKVQVKKLAWLTLGLFFAFLYSCPVKKYLLLTYGKARADESATCQFQKDAGFQGERIVYLRRPCLKTVGVVVAAAVRPAIPPKFFSLSSFPCRYDDGRVNVRRSVFSRNSAIAGSPPRYLEERRFLI
jgi:hypothetical protein